jgi:hypothetical protein
MTKKNFPQVNFTSSQDSKNNFGEHQKGMPTIRCVCGLRILVVPDLKAMNHSIKNHVAEHKQTDYGLTFDSLEEFLTEQILIMAGEINLPNVS